MGSMPIHDQIFQAIHQIASQQNIDTRGIFKNLDDTDRKTALLALTIVKSGQDKGPIDPAKAKKLMDSLSTLSSNPKLINEKNTIRDIIHYLFTPEVQSEQLVDTYQAAAGKQRERETITAFQAPKPQKLQDTDQAAKPPTVEQKKQETPAAAIPKQPPTVEQKKPEVQPQKLHETATEPKTFPEEMQEIVSDPFRKEIFEELQIYTLEPSSLDKLANMMISDERFTKELPKDDNSRKHLYARVINAYEEQIRSNENLSPSEKKEMANALIAFKEALQKTPEFSNVPKGRILENAIKKLDTLISSLTFEENAKASREANLLNIKMEDSGSYRTFSKEELLKFVRHEEEFPQNLAYLDNRQEIVASMDKYLSTGDLNELAKLEKSCNKRLEIFKAIEFSNASRETVRELIMQDNQKQNVPQLTEAANLSFKPLETSDPNFNNLISALAAGSLTATSSREQITAVTNLKRTQILLQQAAAEQLPLTMEFVSEINKTLTANTSNNGGIPGNYRDFGNNVGCINGAYIPGLHVEEEMGKMISWVNEELKNAAGDKTKVIEIAARAYSWSVSIHPFSDGNGRTCRSIANYILMSNDLPPVILELREVKAAVFANSKIQNQENMQALTLSNIVQGMMKTDHAFKVG